MAEKIVLVLIGAISGGLVSAIGWFVTSYLSKRKEYDLQRRNALLKHLERQIEEFYGPLLGLQQESRATFEVSKQVLPMRDDLSYDFSQFTENDFKTYDYFTETYFLPNNAKKADLLTTKLTLLDQGKLPENFEQFLRHQTQYECIHKLMKQGGKYKVDNVSKFNIEDYPTALEEDIQNGLTQCKKEYYALLNSVATL